MRNKGGALLRVPVVLGAALLAFSGAAVLWRFLPGGGPGVPSAPATVTRSATDASQTPVASAHTMGADSAPAGAYVLAVTATRPQATATRTPTRWPSPTPTRTAAWTPTAAASPTVTVVTPTATPEATAADAAPSPVLVPSRTPVAVIQGPTVPPQDRYRIAGLNMADSSAPLSIAYPASLDTDELLRFDGLRILPADFDGTNYRRFVTEYAGQVFVHGDISGAFVLCVHDGTLRSSGRALEAEALRRLIEGDLHAPYPLQVIEANLQRLIGREWILAQNGIEVRFRLVRAVRMDASDVAAYRDRASELSTVIGGIADPARSFLMFFCSGRQPGEPSGTFVGRYVLLLELAE